MAFTSYAQTGPFSDGVTPPGISAAFLGNVETFLSQIVAPIVSDSHVSSDGNGKIITAAIQLTTGSMSRISIFSGSASNTGNTQAHHLGATPDICIVMEVQSSGDNCSFVWDQAASNSTNVKIWTSFATPRNYVALAIKL